MLQDQSIVSWYQNWLHSITPERNYCHTLMSFICDLRNCCHQPWLVLYHLTIPLSNVTNSALPISFLCFVANSWQMLPAQYILLNQYCWGPGFSSCLTCQLNLSVRGKLWSKLIKLPAQYLLLNQYCWGPGFSSCLTCQLNLSVRGKLWYKKTSNSTSFHYKLHLFINPLHYPLLYPLHSSSRFLANIAPIGGDL